MTLISFMLVEILRFLKSFRDSLPGEYGNG